jgi:hypothetical protein
MQRPGKVATSGQGGGEAEQVQQQVAWRRPEAAKCKNRPKPQALEV